MRSDHLTLSALRRIIHLLRENLDTTANVEQVMQWLGRSRETVYRYARLGELEGTHERPLRITNRSIYGYLKQAYRATAYFDIFEEADTDASDGSSGDSSQVRL